MSLYCEEMRRDEARCDNLIAFYMPGFFVLAFLVGSTLMSSL
ncbi:hypothetical protein [Acetivibrio cellulolyticus]